jgi:beclin 1
MMYCQKCRTPLRLDESLENLNPAAFDLLVGMRGNLHMYAGIADSAGSSGKSLPRGTSKHSNYPRERKAIFDQTAAVHHSPTYKRTIPAPQDGKAEPKGHLNPDMSFIEVTESQIVPAREVVKEDKNSSDTKPTPGNGEDGKPPLSWEMQRHEKLFSILSSHSDIDHPICTECTSMLLSSFNARLAASSRERDAYASFLKGLQSGPTIPSAEDAVKAEKELEEAAKREMAAMKELQQLEDEKSALETEIAELEEQSRAMDLEEEQFWAERNSFEDNIHDLTTELTSLQQRHAHDHQQLERLQRTNVYNDTFCIGHDGYFGTINGLRLGRLPNQNVEWPEINAAWGQTLLLLATIAERLGYKFQEYRLRPLGSTSRIEKLEWPQQMPSAPPRATTDRGDIRQPAKIQPKVTALDLFSSGDMPLGRVFYHRKFDAGMVAFLDCLAQLGTYLEKTSAEVTYAESPNSVRSPRKAHAPRVLPYPINGDKIGDPKTNQAVSIKLGAGFQQDESWTKACKYALTCCKYLLAHVSNLESARERRE